MKVVFLDRDGTLIVEPPDEQIDSLDKLELIPGIIEGLRLLKDRGYELVMVTNQDSLGTERFPTAAFEGPQNKLLRILQGEGVTFAHIFVCPHVPADSCDCRKPKTALVTDFLREHKPDLSQSYVIGDRETDVQFGLALGCKTIRLSTPVTSDATYVTPDFVDACRYILRTSRTAHVERKTLETNITADIALDGSGTHTINTGIGFFDHMLAQLSKHSLIDIAVIVNGDLHVDEHHSVEDTGLVLGAAIRSALGDKRGIARYGFVVPMDESLAQVTLDLSDRPYFSLEGGFERENVGELPTESVEVFLRAFADGLRANLHINVTGRNDHHKIEAIFKSLARTLKQAVAVDAQAPSILPSTKGTL